MSIFTSNPYIRLESPKLDQSLLLQSTLLHVQIPSGPQWFTLRDLSELVL